MLRFLSGRKRNASNQIKAKHVPNKNLVQCKVVLLDNTDLSIELSVSFILVFISIIAIIVNLIC